MRNWITLVENASGNTFSGTLILDTNIKWDKLTDEDLSYGRWLLASELGAARDRYQYEVKIEINSVFHTPNDGQFYSTSDLKKKGFDGKTRGSVAIPFNLSQVWLVRDLSATRSNPKYRLVSPAKPKIIQAYHGTTSTFDQFKVGEDGIAWFTSSREHAEYFVRSGGLGRFKGEVPQIITVKIDVSGFLLIQGRGRPIRQTEGPDKTGWDPHEIAATKNLPGVYYRNVLDANDDDIIDGKAENSDVIAVIDLSRLHKLSVDQI